MRTPLLQVKSLSKYFDGLSAINDLSFEVYEGECVGLIGPNGAGKTTCLDLLTGFLRPSAGTVHFKGTDVTALKSHQIARLGIGRTFERVRPFGALTVLENVIVPAAMAHQAGRFDEDVHTWAGRIVERVGLSRRLHDTTNTLSHGELKRLEIARALAVRPELLLLDEPFGGLSQEERDALEQLIRDLFEEGLTVVLVEQVLRVLMSLAQRVLVLNYGQLIASGTPAEISDDDAVIRAYLGAEYERVAAGRHTPTVGGGEP